MGIAEELESPQCMTCIYKDEGEVMCSAFPFGILPDILQNRILHDHVVEEQFGDFVYKEV